MGKTAEDFFYPNITYWDNCDGTDSVSLDFDSVEEMERRLKQYAKEI